MASAVHGRRREPGRTVEEVARSADVDARDVMALEAGETVDDHVPHAVCAVLGIPVHRHFGGAPHGLVQEVTPVDAAHARSMAAIVAAAGDDGWLLLPDVEAHDAAEGWSEEGRVQDERQRRMLIGLLGIGLAACVAGVGTGAVTSMCLWLSMITHAFGSPTNPAPIATWAFEHPGLSCLGPLSLAATYGVARAARRLWERTRFPRVMGIQDRTRLREGAKRDGIVFTRDGIRTLEVRPEGVCATDFPTSMWLDAEVVAHGDSHVTVRIETRDVLTEVMWLPRCRDVTDMLEGWIRGREKERRRVAQLRLPGKAYVIAPAPKASVLEGPQ